MPNRSRIRAAALIALCTPLVLHADPLHAIADDAFWHHESNFIFLAALGDFIRVGAPQEVDGSTTVVAHYSRGTGEAREVVVVEVVPLADAATVRAGKAAGSVVTRIIDHAGWRVAIHATSTDAAARERIEALVRALPVERLGEVDTRCPNAGCGR
jgi:hypothetical protein